MVALQMHSSIRVRETTPERMQRLAGLLCEDHGVVLLGSKPVEPVAGAVDLCGRVSLEVAAAVLEQADVVVGLDSGLTHLANALQRPTVAIYGPGDPALLVCGQPYCHPVQVHECGGCAQPCRNLRPLRACRAVAQCLDKFPVELVVKAVGELCL